MEESSIMREFFTLTLTTRNIMYVLISVIQTDAGYLKSKNKETIARSAAGQQYVQMMSGYPESSRQQHQTIRYFLVLLSVVISSFSDLFLLCFFLIYRVFDSLKYNRTPLKLAAPGRCQQREYCTLKSGLYPGQVCRDQADQLSPSLNQL